MGFRHADSLPTNFCDSQWHMKMGEREEGGGGDKRAVRGEGGRESKSAASCEHNGVTVNKACSSRRGGAPGLHDRLSTRPPSASGFPQTKAGGRRDAVAQS